MAKNNKVEEAIKAAKEKEEEAKRAEEVKKALFGDEEAAEEETEDQEAGIEIEDGDDREHQDKEHDQETSETFPVGGFRGLFLMPHRLWCRRFLGIAMRSISRTRLISRTLSPLFDDLFNRFRLGSRVCLLASYVPDGRRMGVPI